jgi:tuftelin-interacting protein 11
LPKWFFSNIIIQLVLPKLERYLEDHKISKANDGHKLHVWLFPWLPLLGNDTMRPIWKTVRRKIQLFLQNWDPVDPIAMEILDIWSQVWDDSDTQALITNSILPKLVIYLRHSFAINPSNQDLVPLLNVFGWKTYIPAHLFSHLLESEFFKGTWVTSAQANLDEISQWYTHWKKLFADHGLEKIESCKNGFKTGLDMMNQGVSASLDKKGRAAFIPSIQIAPGKAAALQAPILDAQSITFKDMATEVFAESSLEFIPIGKQHRETGKDLYKLGKRIYIYIDDGVLYCSYTGSGGEYKFMSIDDAIELAQKYP